MYICKWIICSQWKDCNWKNTSVCDLSSQMVALFVQLLPLHNSLNYPFHHSYIIQNILYSIVLYCMCVLTKWILIDFDKPFICCFHQVIVRQLMNIVLTPNPWFFSFCCCCCSRCRSVYICQAEAHSLFGLGPTCHKFIIRSRNEWPQITCNEQNDIRRSNKPFWHINKEKVASFLTWEMLLFNQGQIPIYR